MQAETRPHPLLHKRALAPTHTNTCTCITVARFEARARNGQNAVLPTRQQLADFTMELAILAHVLPRDCRYIAVRSAVAAIAHKPASLDARRCEH